MAVAARPTSEEEHAHTLFTVLPERYNNEAIGLDTIIEGQLAGCTDPAARAQMAVALSASLQKALGELGLPIPLHAVLGFMSTGAPDPSQFVKAFSLLSTSAIHAGFFVKLQLRDVQAAQRPAKPYVIEGDSFDLDSIDAYLAANRQRIVPEESFPLRPVDPATLPGLYFGTSRPWADSDDVRGINTLFAEIFSRLMYNYAAAPGCPVRSSPEPQRLFTVTLHGRSITRVDDLFEELEREEGSSLEGGMLKSCARFGTVLSYQHPAAGADAPYLDVPFTLFIGTGITNRSSGKQAYVPMIHAAFFLHFRSPRFNFDIEFYLGTGSPAQFRDGSKLLLPWAAPLVTHTFSRDDTLRAIRACALHGNVLSDLAVRDHLPMGGYGSCGVCADSVAPVEQLILGKTTVYPLLAMIGSKTNMLAVYKQLAAYFRQQLAAGADSVRPVDLELALALPRAAAALPSDVDLSLPEYNDTMRRILDAMPWPKGSEPFKHAVRARYIIEQELANPWYLDDQ